MSEYNNLVNAAWYNPLRKTKIYGSSTYPPLTYPPPEKNKALRNKAYENPLVSLCFLNKALLFIKPLFLRGLR